MNKLYALLFCFAFAKAITAQSSDIPKRVYTTAAITATETIEIDGLMEDPAWSKVEWASDFIEREPAENTQPTYQTKFKILYDDKNLYVLVRAIDDEPDLIEQRLSRRDGFAGDFVEINIDSYNDKRTAFSFSATAAGVKGDEFVTNNGNNWDPSWNPIWYYASSVDGTGWTAEFRIPLSQLKFSSADEQVWGLQVMRRFFRDEERSVWQRIPLDAGGFISEFGELRGLKGIKPQKQLEIQPFIVGQYDTYEEQVGNPFRTGKDFKLNAGIDAKIGITNDLTLDLTINPDFGQVEADPAAIALDGFQIFFREQRPFFVENANLFSFRNANQDNLFYSRRIGRSPQGSAFGPNTQYADEPNNTTILGAAKFSGKTKDGWSIGILETITQEEVAETINTDGSKEDVVVEPLTNYALASVRKDLNEGNTVIGGMITATNRNLDDNLAQSLHKSAYSAGLDFTHNWNDRKYFLSGTILGSQVNGTKEAITRTQRSITHLFQREDAGHVSVDPNRTSLSGTGGKIVAGKGGGGNWRFESGAFWNSPELELNDIGFLRQADDIVQFNNVNYLFQKPTSWYRNANIRVSQFTSYDFDGNTNRFQIEGRAEVNFKNNAAMGIGGAHKPRIYINTFLRGGPRWRFSEENFGFIYGRTDNRKKFWVGGEFVYSEAKQENFKFIQAELNLNWQPTDALSLSFRPNFNTNPNRTQYVTQVNNGGNTRYITGNIDNQTLSAQLRLNYNINPNLTIQYYAQPFVSRGRYTDFNYVDRADAKDINDRVIWYDDNQITAVNGGYTIDENRDGTVDYSFGNPDFNFVQFRSNLVMRWEYIPGSELFFVWSQGSTGGVDGDQSLGNALDTQILGNEIENTFLIKATYRFVL